MKKIPNKFKARVLLLLAITSMSGCAGHMSQREAEETRAAYRGAAMQQALQNAHDAAFNQGVYREQEHRDQSHGNKHHHHHGE